MTSAIAARLARFLVLFSLLAGSAAWAQTSPVEILGRLPSIENIAVSPDGSRLAMIRTQGDKRLLVMVSLSDGKATNSQEISGTKLRDLEWADDNNLLFTISTYDRLHGLMSVRYNEWWILTSLNLTKNRVVNPLSIMPEAESHNRAFTAPNFIIGEPSIRKIKDETLVYVPGLSESPEKGFMATMFKFKAGVNVTRLVGRTNQDGTEWLVDDSGIQVVSSYYDDDSQNWIMNVLLNGSWKQVISEPFSIDRPQATGLLPGGQSVLVRYFNKDSKKYSWMTVSLKDGTVNRSNPDYEKYGSKVVSSLRSAALLGAYRLSDDEFEFFDPKKQEVWAYITTALDGHKVKFISASDDWKKIAILVEGKRFGYSYMMFDTEKYKFTNLGATYSGYTSPAVVEQVSYSARDQYQLNAFVTYPEGARKNLPVVMLPHGGPEWHDDGRFDWWAQALASQGYLVIQPNFRGSNTTIQLRDAGFGEWGRKMQTDISDALAEMVKRGIADPKRVCIVGGSYGGYAALAGATFDASAYRCAISVAGISDLREMRRSIMSDTNKRNSMETRYFDRYWGASSLEDPVLRERSPVNLVSKASIPVLLLHGTDDTVVPIKHSELMFDALKRANRTVEFVKLEHEDHWLSNSNTRLQALQAMVDFLKKNNPPN